MQPMIELGEFASEEHMRVGKYAREKCDYVFLTNNNWAEDFLKGWGVEKKDNVIIGSTKHNAYQLDTLEPKRGDAILFKGKEAEQVLHMYESF